MLALVAQADQPAVLATAPRPHQQTGLLVRVEMVGVCKTDIAAARGDLILPKSRILGHEAVGTVESVGGNSVFTPGDRVALVPWVHCGTCADCESGHSERCCHAEFLGVDRDGAFAEYVAMPERAAVLIPGSVDWKTAALLEPMAAARAVLEPLASASGTVALLGKGRFLSLLELAVRDSPRELNFPGYSPGTTYDWVIDAEGTRESLAQAVEAVRPGGTIIVKSRPSAPVEFPLRRAVQKEVSLKGANYASFDETMLWIGRHVDALAPLLGPTFTLSEFNAAFAHPDGAQKTFLVPGAQSCAV